VTTFQRGLLPFDPEKHARFATTESLGFTIPAPVYPIVRTEGITDWGMGGNGPDPTLMVNGGQPVGDCGPCVCPMHADMLTAVLTGLGLPGNTMTSDQVVTLYFQYTGGQDTGVDLGDWLLWLFQQGLIEGFVAIPLAQMDAALGYFNVVVTGVNLNPNADQQVTDNVPWDVGPGDMPDPSEGHAVLYAEAQSASGPYGWITWGQVQPSTHAWKVACPQQAFAVISKQEAEAKGFTAQFDAAVVALHALGGTVVPAPTPTPVPPSPTPPAPPQPVSPTPPKPPAEVVGWFREFLAWLETWA
jgi:hypothetical protein